MPSLLVILTAVLSFVSTQVSAYDVRVVKRDADPILSYITGTSTYKQIFNPTWVEASAGTGGKRGILARTQNCDADVDGTCVFCGGAADKASILTS